MAAARRAMHVSPSTLSRQIQRLERTLGQPLFVQDDRTVILPKPGKGFVPLPNRLYCSISSFVASSIGRAFRSPASCTSSALSPPPIAICRQSSTAFAPRTPRWRSRALDRRRRRRYGEGRHRRTAPARLPVSRGLCQGRRRFDAGEPRRGVDCPRPSLPGAQPGDRRAPDWSTVPFYHGRAGPVRRRIELWFRRHKISNPSIYATVGGHEAMVSMVAAGMRRGAAAGSGAGEQSGAGTQQGDDPGAQR